MRSIIFLRDINIHTDPPTVVQADGEMWGETPITVEVLPGVLPILTDRA